MSHDIHPIEAWLKVHDPTIHRAIHTPEAMDAMRALAVAMPGDIAPSQAAVTGPGAVAAKTNTEWRTNPALGAVNCAQMARIAAGYNPTDLDNAGATTIQYNDFLRRLARCPLYVVKLADSLEVEQKTSDWNTLISAIADTFEGIAAEDKNTIVKGLKTLAQAASSKMEKKQKAATFVQNVVNVDGVITMYVYSSQTTFYEKSGKGYDTKENTFKVNRLNLEFQSSLWPEWWSKVKDTFDGSMDDWLNDNRTAMEGIPPIPAFGG